MHTINNQVQQMNHFFNTHKTYDMQYRLHFLKRLKKSIIKYQKDIELALYKDFKKPAFETNLTEIYPVIEEINEALKSLKKWSRPKKVSIGLPFIGGQAQIISEPYGICTIFTPFNYPFQLACIPLIGAIAAGNCVIIKPSEYTPFTIRILQRILSEVFPPYYVCVIEGDTHTAESLLNQQIHYIFFTGSPSIGRKVMEQAAQHLIPTTLELGGKSPTIVDSSADLKLAAKRIVWGKFLNAGQTCVAPDYVLVDESVAEQLLCHIGFILQKFHYTKQNMAHIINESHYVRLLQLIDEDRICFGGHFDTDSLYIEPTVLYPANFDDPCMQEEIFGPILPIIPYKSLNKVVSFIQNQPHPLACYVFSTHTQNIQYLFKHLSFGGGCLNDTILHAAYPNLPFGGVGNSGIGKYHGQYSFETFSHTKTIITHSIHEIPLRYPPYNKNTSILRKLVQKK